MEEISNLLPTKLDKVEVSSEPQKQELIPLATGDPEERFATALNDGRISGGSIDDLKGTVKQIMVKVGLRAANWPKDEEKAVLLSHILAHYGNHTHQELLLAFDMAIGGLLDVEANCYENFSCLYFAGIMNAYREWSTEAYLHVSKSPPKALPKPKEDISDEGMSKWLDELKGQRMPVIFLPLQLYVWLIKTGRLKPTIRQKWEYMEKAVAYQQGKLIQACDEVMNQENRQALSEFNRMKAAGEFEGAVADQLRNLAKKMILFDYLYATP